MESNRKQDREAKGAEDLGRGRFQAAKAVQRGSGGRDKYTYIHTEQQRMGAEGGKYKTAEDGIAGGRYRESQAVLCGWQSCEKQWPWVAPRKTLLLPAIMTSEQLLWTKLLWTVLL